MLAVAPDRVDMSKAEPWAGLKFGPGAFGRTDASSPNYSPSSIYGDPTLVSKDKGDRLLHAMLVDLMALV